MIKVDKNLCSTSYHTWSGYWGQNQLPTPQNPPKCWWIWSGDTSISSSDHVVSDDIKIFAVSWVVFKWRGGGTKCPPPSSYVSQKPITDRVKLNIADAVKHLKLLNYVVLMTILHLLGGRIVLPYLFHLLTMNC